MTLDSEIQLLHDVQHNTLCGQAKEALCVGAIIRWADVLSLNGYYREWLKGVYTAAQMQQEAYDLGCQVICYLIDKKVPAKRKKAVGCYYQDSRVNTLQYQHQPRQIS